MGFVDLLPAAQLSGIVSIEAQASALAGKSLVRVDFYVDDIFQGSDADSPYLFELNSSLFGNGNHTLKLLAVDSEGKIGQEEVVVEFANQLAAPEVALLAPAHGSKVQGVITLKAEATAQSGKQITKVEFFLGEHKAGETSSVPFSVSYDSTLLPDGNYIVKVLATDSEGKTGQDSGKIIEIDNIQTQIAISAPLNGAVLSGNQSVAVQASADIKKVKFFINNQEIFEDQEAPFGFSWNTQEVPNGSYQVKAVGYGANNTLLATSSALEVSVVNAVSLVDIISPAPGVVSALVDISVNATADIKKVKFYRSGVFLGEDNTAPFSFSWDTGSLANGSYALKVEGYNQAGELAASDDDTVVMVENIQSTLSITAPQTAQVVSGMFTIKAEGTADIKKVSFLVNNVLLHSDDSAPFEYNWNTQTSLDGATLVTVKGYNGQDLEVAAVAVSVQVSNGGEEYTPVNLETLSFSPNPGNIGMTVYVPAGMKKNQPRPLVVGLAGCNHQSLTDYVNGTQWHKLADKYKFYLVVSKGVNPMGCFDWFNTGDLSRGQGEAASVNAMISKMKATYNIDGAKVFATGLSAGASTAVNLAAAYPDVFAGIFSAAALPYKTAKDANEGTAAMNNVATGGAHDKTPAQWAALVKSGYAGYTGKYPKILAFHGCTKCYASPEPADYTRGDGVVDFRNLRELTEQWSEVHGTGQTPSFEESIGTGGIYRKVFRNAQGESVLETYAVEGLGHASPVDPGTGETQGGDSSVGFSKDVGIYGPYVALKFWGIISSGPVDHFPVINIISPSDGEAQLSGVVSVQASLSDDKALSKVELYVKGLLVDTKNYSGTAANYQYNWDTAGLTDGDYVLLFKAHDSVGQITEKSITVSVGESIFVCRQWTTDNKSHVSAGRAVVYTQWYNEYAKTVGKGEELGLHNQWTNSTVKETAPGYFEKGSCN
ncbi:MAG: hypothetical protein CVV50_01430 [Spirochaetae bacterium HGW-Spirochaetae-6]|nr:MAG: hypothetical protein CVV50_01430 [Spirochaetae bacterium HGW-Spirochaetae-6]